MGTDRARNSFDADRQYRSVVAQQGRVTLEADVNEAEAIRTAESRAELVDIVGPTGSPDAGYEITIPGGGTAFGFAIGAGTIYVGGQRLHLAAGRTYETQKPVDWVDCPVPDPDLPAGGPASEIIYLQVVEQEVTAVEDEALREIALGGPDTCGRTRLIARVRRAPASGADCVPGLVEVLAKRAPGLALDPATLELVSSGQLRISFVDVPDAANQCQPIAKAGFLGAENQLIRVQVASDGTLLWAYDNGSALYRAKTPSTTAGPVMAIELVGDPVDEFHRPRPGQWLEILRTAVTLDDGDYIAGAVGELHEIAAYNAAANSITLVAAATALDGPQLFVRVWEGHIPFATTGTELVEAAGTRLGVVVTTTGAAVPGDYWMIGVRPTQPNKLYPARFAQPQPPDGPLRWATPLATITWNTAGTGGAVHDCRKPFKPLTDDTCDLPFHNQHLHGWGVVCGLQVRCVPPGSAPGGVRLRGGGLDVIGVDAIGVRDPREPRERPGEWVNVFNGYAIDPTGVDIRVQSPTQDKFTPLDVGSLADKVLGRDGNGAIGNGTVSLWIDPARTFHVEKFEPKPDPTWLDTFEDTLLVDIYKDCIQNILDFVNSQIMPGATDGLVGPAAKRLIAVINLVIQLFNQTSGRRVYLSGDTDPAAVETEDAILRALFEGLKSRIASKAFCAAFDGIDYPTYDGVHRDGTAKPATIFGTGHHTRIRLHPTKPFAFTCGNGPNIHVYDLTARKIAWAIPFPVADAQVQDVAISKDGGTVYAIAWTGAAQAESTFAFGPLEANGNVTSWQHRADALKLVTLAIPLVGNGVLAAARGRGIYAFDPSSTANPPTVVESFYASGHLVTGERQVAMYAGEHTDDPMPLGFNQIRAIRPGTLTKTFPIPGLAGDARGIGYDDLAIGGKLDAPDLYAIVDAEPGRKRLLRWPGADGEPAIIQLGASTGNRIAFSATRGWALITCESDYAGRVYLPGAAELETRFLHPLQIAPTSIASDREGAWFYVLEAMSNTITAIPATGDPATPWASTIDLAALEKYRRDALSAYVRLLGRLAQYLKDCICDHLLVDCPDPRGKVYLADITFKDGAVFQICNFHKRRYVHTFPTVEYWMSIVPILPWLKEQIGKICCAVIDKMFDKYLPPDDAKNDLPDKLAMTGIRNAQLYLKDANLPNEVARRKLQLAAGTMLARTALTEKLALPPRGRSAPPIAATSFVANTADEATRLAKSRGVQVRQVVVSSDALTAALKVAFATPAVDPGDTVDLITDTKGRVIGIAKVAPADPAAGTTAPPAARDEVATLRRDLDSVLGVRDQQVATIKEMQAQIKELHESLKALTPP